MTVRLIVLLLLLAALLSCSGVGNLKSNRERWNAAGITNYRMKLHVEKTGHAGPMGNVVIEVKDGNVVSMDRGQGDWYGGDIEKCAAFNTVPKMFDFIEQAASRKPDRINVSYDSTLGYPTRLGLDYDTRGMDDELMWEVKSLERVE
jgi:Family of unknown function (DUF6174)